MGGVLKPPDTVYLMQSLNKIDFQKLIKVPVINIDKAKISSVLPLVKKKLLKVENFKPIEHVNPDNVSVYLNPEVIEKWADLAEDLVEQNLSEEIFEIKEFTLKYENYTHEDILRAVLPKDKEGVSSFTKVGHIVHVNLREHLLPYKNLIGEVLFDKVSGCKSVVNKTNMIDNTYRNFQMEVLKGETSMLTIIKENNCRFEFDFSTVYWNSRLCTEHERIVKILKPNDVLLDVFAGVGPFSIPLAKKKCQVFANDLNPESYKWLMHNKKLNKISDDCFEGYNLDGRDFILNVVKKQLPKFIKDRNIFIIMNLPAMAVEFLDVFVGLLTNIELPESLKPITLFVYCFAKGENPEETARNLILENLKVENVDVSSKITDIFRVRTVSSMKEMMRVTFTMDRDILVGNCNKRKIKDKVECGGVKKICSNEANDKNGQKQEEIKQCLQSSRSKEFENESQS